MDFIVKDDHILKESVYGSTITRSEVVIDKQTFVEAYNKWIKETEKQEAEDTNIKFLPKYTASEVVKILKDLQSDLEEMKMKHNTDKDTWNNAINVCSHLIDSKIRLLKSIEQNELEALKHVSIKS